MAALTLGRGAASSSSSFIPRSGKTEREICHFEGTELRGSAKLKNSKITLEVV